MISDAEQRGPAEIETRLRRDVPVRRHMGGSREGFAAIGAAVLGLGTRVVDEVG